MRLKVCQRCKGHSALEVLLPSTKRTDRSWHHISCPDCEGKGFRDLDGEKYRVYTSVEFLKEKIIEQPRPLNQKELDEYSLIYSILVESTIFENQGAHSVPRSRYDVSSVLVLHSVLPFSFRYLFGLGCLCVQIYNVSPHRSDALYKTIRYKLNDPNVLDQMLCDFRNPDGVLVKSG